MEKTQKIIVILLIVAIVFSVISTMLNLSLVNLEFQPVNVKVPSNLQGNQNGQVVMNIERNPGSAG